jgi:hypothetical protein
MFDVFDSMRSDEGKIERFESINLMRCLPLLSEFYFLNARFLCADAVWKVEWLGLGDFVQYLSSAYMDD